VYSTRVHARIPITDILARIIAPRVGQVGEDVRVGVGPVEFQLYRASIWLRGKNLRWHFDIIDQQTVNEALCCGIGVSAGTCCALLNTRYSPIQYDIQFNYAIRAGLISYCWSHVTHSVPMCTAAKPTDCPVRSHLTSDVGYIGLQVYMFTMARSVSLTFNLYEQETQHAVNRSPVSTNYWVLAYCTIWNIMEATD